MEKKYTQFIEGIEFIDIFLNKCSFQRHSSPDPDNFPEIQAILSLGEASFSQNDEDLYIEQNFTFSIEETHETESRKVFEIEGVFTLFYKTSSKLNKELFDMFKNNNIPVNLRPYLRELVHSSMTRCNLPPFILPVIKIKR